ncbi:unnamed protein product [Didymodactylos carnosus]|uniref:RBR-type E3 ubiquitin transferase n=1 Tax=Didymodactylos carnosus TaxID=1234261 RepID=A0A814XK27_9BILA|nr:unnamed protein product [Didymodactylos carnosus]CAF1212301.1 unnamed protein product [Didymodactylos carnosus]CAF3768729.1 unnamed protein product [Didymodactylos carnosus]CAF3976269.1 unnamed protein product [Didymodactylos carnosus]
MTSVTSKTTDCVSCMKPVPSDIYRTHIQQCVARNEPSPVHSSKELDELLCNSCLKIVEKDFIHEIPCHFKHKYCVTCLTKQAQQYVRDKSVPVCHPKKCDYELSKHDIGRIPLVFDMYQKLEKLVKGQSRPQCGKCWMYFDELDKHQEECQGCEWLIPCDYCTCLYDANKLNEHIADCQKRKNGQWTIIEFIQQRTKYPLSGKQLELFLNKRKKDKLSLHIPDIIETLAEYGPIFPFDIPTRVCDVCTDSCTYDDIFVFDCESNHKLCYSCYHDGIRAKFNSQEILCCPLCSANTAKPLLDGEINQLRIPIEDIRKYKDYQTRKTFATYSNSTRGVIKCPNRECQWLVEAHNPEERFKVNCGLCNNEFCSLCNEQYHYRTNCQDVAQLTQRWYFWCQTERGNYLRQRAAADEKYQGQLNEYNRARDQNVKRNQELQHRYTELVADEQYKATNCRLCPKCRRVVQKIEGCDAMVCGQDAHGGNIQSGCSNKFNWSQAPVYQAQADQQQKFEQFLAEMPKQQIIDHNGIQCDNCKEEIRGIRFVCIHCPTLTFCEKCEQQQSLEHHNENTFNGEKQHVFKLITKRGEE